MSCGGSRREAGTDHNRWLRQFISYYEMVASLVHRGVLDRDLLEDSVHEYVGFYAILRNIERMVEESTRGRENLARIEKWLAAGAGAKH
jgi:hypothetical protein